MRRTAGRLLVAASLGAGCSSGSDGVSGAAPGYSPSFPADYASTYREVRSCRQSSEHDLGRVRVLADPAAFEPYQTRVAPIPLEGVLLKEEYDVSDTTCSGPVVQWTVMRRLAPGSSSETLDWRWERVNADRVVVGTDTPRCWGCHAACTLDTGGFEYTCTVP